MTVVSGTTSRLAVTINVGRVLHVVGNGDLFGQFVGGRPPKVLALHGWGRSHRDFDGILDGSDALAIDLPGFGASPLPAQALDTQGMADVVAPVLDRCAPQVVIVGHSLGGRVAMKLARTFPDRIRALILLGVPLLPSSSTSSAPVMYRALRRLHRWHVVSDEMMESARQKYGSPDYRRAQGVMRETLVRIVNDSYLEDLKQLETPVRLIWAIDDVDTPLSIAQRSLEVFPNASLVTLPDGGHFGMLAHKSLVRNEIEKALV